MSPYYKFLWLLHSLLPGGCAEAFFVSAGHWEKTSLRPWPKTAKSLYRRLHIYAKLEAFLHKYTVVTAAPWGINSGFFQQPRAVLGPSGAFRGTARVVKVTVFYKTGVIGDCFAAISGSSEVGFRSRRDGHFFARDGLYDSNDHREHPKGRFRVVRKWPFSAPLSPRRAYRQTMEGCIAPRPTPKCTKCIFIHYRIFFTSATNIHLAIIRK